MRSVRLHTTASLSAARFASASGASATSSWFASTSQYSRRYSIVSSNTSRVTSTFGFSLTFTRLVAQCSARAIQEVRQPHRHARPDVHDHQAEYDDRHVRHHAGEDLVERDV